MLLRCETCGTFHAKDEPHGRTAENMPKPPQVSDATRRIVNQGAGILLPFEAGDAPVTFQRWRLAELIEEALEEARS